MHPPSPEAHALPLQAQALFPAGLARQGDAPAGGDHAMPGQAQARAQRPRHLPRRAGVAGPGGDLPIGRDAAGRNAPDDCANAGVAPKCSNAGVALASPNAGVAPIGSHTGVPAAGGNAGIQAPGVIACLQPGDVGGASTAAAAALRLAPRSPAPARGSPLPMASSHNGIMPKPASPTADLPRPAMRRERDSMGEIEVPAERMWGAQTQRSLHHFSIGGDRMPREIYHAYGVIKQAAARVNQRAGRLDAARAEAVARAAAEAVEGQLDGEFPLFVWQTGSGTQTNMNVNEVLAHRAAQLAPAAGTIHPNDHVNLAQSSNDTFPTATHIAAVLQLQRRLLPALEALAAAIEAKSAAWMDVVKIGRTHLQDAVPLTVGQEWSGYAAQLRANIAHIRAALPALRELAAGGTAVGTGLNSPPEFAAQIAAEIAALTGEPFVTAPNKFAALAGADAMAAASGAVRGAAAALAKIANDIRFLGSGPRCGLGELILPANEPGSSIMPGKVNPTQCEAMLMVCAQVIGEDAIIAGAAAQGNFELNTMRPLIAFNFLHATGILADAARNFRVFCIEGIELNRERIGELVQRSLMLVTALTPAIGYDKAAKIAHDALERNQTLREAAVASGWISGEDFDRIVVPKDLTHPR